MRRNVHDGYVRQLRRLGLFTGIVVVMGTIFTVAHHEFRYVRNGADLIYAAKLGFIHSGNAFPPAAHAKARVAIFGDSKILSGFKPELFDSLSEGRAYSVNFGLPNADHFVAELEAIADVSRPGSSGPTIVFMTIPWSQADAPSTLDLLRNEVWLRDHLFPFHSMPRDLLLFAARSRGGLLASYRAAELEVAGALRNRGYYFIKGQSHFPMDRLPENFRLDGDRPGRIATRELTPRGNDYLRLVDIGRRRGICLLMVPTYFRQGEVAEPPRVEPGVRRPAGLEGIGVLGPDYFVLPNRYFSDQTHLNPEGAAIYTKCLWELAAPLFAADGTEMPCVKGRP
jgi:hypothetical protein